MSSRKVPAARIGGRAADGHARIALTLMSVELLRTLVGHAFARSIDAAFIGHQTMVLRPRTWDGFARALEIEHLLAIRIGRQLGPGIPALSIRWMPPTEEIAPGLER